MLTASHYSIYQSSTFLYPSLNCTESYIPPGEQQQLIRLNVVVLNLMRGSLHFVFTAKLQMLGMKATSVHQQLGKVTVSCHRQYTGLTCQLVQEE